MLPELEMFVRGTYSETAWSGSVMTVRSTSSATMLSGSVVFAPGSKSEIDAMVGRDDGEECQILGM